MIRFSLLLVSFIAFFTSCTSAPDITRSETYGSDSHPLIKTVSGSADENAALNRATPPTGLNRMKSEDVRVLVAQYEVDMDEYLVAGDYAAALDSFNKAVDILASTEDEAAMGSSIREKIYYALKTVQVTPVSVPGDTVAGRAFSRSFSVKVVAMGEDSGIPLAGVPCAVAYPVYRDDGSVVAEMAELKTDETGIAAFVAPVPTKMGKNTLTISVNFPIRDEVLVSKLHQDVPDNFTVSFVHGVETTRKSIPTTISILDYNKKGNPLLSYSQSATLLLRPLIQNGFSRIGMADFPRQLAAGDEEKLIAAAQAQFGSGVQRFIYGTNRIESLEKKEDGQWSCTMIAVISVWDFTRNQKSYQTTITHVATGATEAAAIQTARNELAGSVLVDDLRYNL